MLADVLRLSAGVVIFISLIGASLCYSNDKKPEAVDSLSHSAMPTAVSDRTNKTPSDEDIGLFDTSALVEKIGNELHAVAKEERLATLDYLTKERRETMVALEAIGNRVVENAILKSERLIDHFFVRILQLMVVTVLVVCMIGLLFYRRTLHRKNQT